MNYFTPDLLARFGSEDDHVAGAAADEWERAHGAYLKHLGAIRAALPGGARSLIEQFALHDAKVLALGVSEDSQTLSVFVQFQ